jgi:hypothetical protein
MYSQLDDGNTPACREKARMPRLEERGGMAKLAFSLEEAPCGSTGFFPLVQAMGALLPTRIVPGPKSLAILGGPTQIELKERVFDVPDEKKSTVEHYTAMALSEAKVKFEVYGEEMIEKKVRLSGNSGRVYLPPDWVDHHVKIIRID